MTFGCAAAGRCEDGIVRKTFRSVRVQRSGGLMIKPLSGWKDGVPPGMCVSRHPLVLVSRSMLLTECEENKIDVMVRALLCDLPSFSDVCGV